MVSYDTEKQFSDNHQKSSIFALAYHDALLLSILFHFQVHIIENKPFEKKETYHFLHRCFKLFFSFFFFCWLIGRQLPSWAIKVELIHPPFKVFFLENLLFSSISTPLERE